MRVLNLLCSGGTGGIEVLCLEYAQRSSLDNRYLMLWKSGVIYQEMQQHGIPVEVYHTAASRYFMDWFRFLHKCKAEKIEVLVFHQTSPLIALCVLGCKLFCPNVRIIGYAHSDWSDWGRKEQYGARLAFSCAEKIICISQAVRKSVEKLPGVREKCVLIFNGVDTSKFVASRHEPSQDKLELVYVGRLIREKGVDNILLGLSSMAEAFPFHFRIIGDGPERKNLEELCEKLALQDKVSFLGNCRDVPELHKTADVFIHLPNCQEGFGITIIEAMAAGLVCIGNFRGAIPEIIRDGENGFLIREPQQLGQVLERIWTEPDRVRAIRQAAVKTSLSFDINKYVQKMDELLSESCFD